MYSYDALDRVTAVKDKTEGTAKRFLTEDHLDSTIGLTDPTGAVARRYTYTPDGEDSTTGSGPGALVRFAGGHPAGTGLYRFGARYYAPPIATWTQRDPIRQPASLRQASPYIYAGGDPINLRDPDGLRYTADTDYGCYDGMYAGCRTGYTRYGNDDEKVENLLKGECLAAGVALSFVGSPAVGVTAGVACDVGM